MKRFLLSIVSLVASLAMSAQTEVVFDFDKNATALFGIEGRSSSDSTDGDITEAVTATVDGVSVTVSPAEEGKTANRLWTSSAVLRMYSGTLTVAAEGHKITSIKFSQSKWGASNTFSSGAFESNVWTADSEVSNVVLTIGANTQLKSMTVTLDGNGGGQTDPVELAGTGEGTVESPYDVERARSIIENDKVASESVYVAGTITQIDEVSLQYGNATYVLGQGELTLKVYRGYSLGGDKFTSEDEIKVGDKLVVCGKLVTGYGGQITTGSSIYSINGKTKDEEPPVTYEPTGNGSKENPYTVEDIVGLNIQAADGNKYWVKGFILGCAASNSSLAEGDKIGDTNIALAASADATTFIPVALPAGDLRGVLGVATNPKNVGREVMVYGTLEKYFSVAGVKNVSDYQWLSADEPDMPEGYEAIYDIDFAEANESIFEGDNPWEYFNLDMEEYDLTDAKIGQFTTNGYVFSGNIDGTVGTYYSLLASPYFDLREYNGVYVEWEETCSGFGDDDIVLASTAAELYYYLNDSYSDDEGQYSYFSPETRAADNGVATKCRINIPDNYEGMRDRVYVSFDYFSYTADDEYDEWCGTWTIKKFGVYGRKNVGDRIERIEPVMPKDMKVYDLTGRQSNTLRKGINIVNGNKVIVK